MSRIYRIALITFLLTTVPQPASCYDIPEFSYTTDRLHPLPARAEWEKNERAQRARQNHSYLPPETPEIRGEAISTSAPTATTNEAHMPSRPGEQPEEAPAKPLAMPERQEAAHCPTPMPPEEKKLEEQEEEDAPESEPADDQTPEAETPEEPTPDDDEDDDEDGDDWLSDYPDDMPDEMDEEFWENYYDEEFDQYDDFPEEMFDDDEIDFDDESIYDLPDEEVDAD